ncbi:MAG: radical SAM protein [Candidatus Baldrarchaeia archaeon]
MKIREIFVKSVLSKSRIYGVMYAVNPYVGCGHGCAYCYARFMKRYTGHEKDKWGKFVDIKINAPTVIAKETKKARPGPILISSVTDAYQPLERRYEITRKILEVLTRRKFPVIILTKSSLVTRDIDLLKKLKHCEVGFTIVTLDDSIREKFEPRASPIKDRLEALWELHQENIPTYGFIGPILPFLSDETIEDLILKLKEVGCSSIMVDRLNIKYGNWKSIKETLQENYPSLLKKYEEILFSKSNYFEKVKNKIIDIAKKYNIEVDFCY